MASQACLVSACPQAQGQEAEVQTLRAGINQTEDIFGVASLIFWTLTLIVVVKVRAPYLLLLMSIQRSAELCVHLQYLLIVLECDDRGEGGTFAMYVHLLVPLWMLTAAGSLILSTLRRFSLLCRYTSITPGEPAIASSTLPQRCLQAPAVSASGLREPPAHALCSPRHQARRMEEMCMPHDIG